MSSLSYEIFLSLRCRSGTKNMNFRLPALRCRPIKMFIDKGNLDKGDL